MKGIDVSSHNGNINFGEVKESGVEVAIIKATEGVDFIDSYLDRHYQGAKSVGLNIGFYHFMSEKTDPVRQAEDFWNSIKNKEYNVIPTLDIEVNNYGRSAGEITDRCLTFLNRFKELSGKDCMIYTGGYFGRDNLDSRIKGYKGWIAHYGVDYPMNTGFPVVGHQYTETGRVPGINGNVDMNNFNEGIFLDNAVVVNNATTQQTIGGKIAELQAICGVAVDNVWGPITDNAVKNLPLAGLPYCTPKLTKWIQARVGENVDGIFGPATESAVKGWQASHGLAIDGIAGYNTIKSLALA
mgnify:CR=1 FL=1